MENRYLASLRHTSSSTKVNLISWSTSILWVYKLARSSFLTGQGIASWRNFPASLATRLSTKGPSDNSHVCCSPFANPLTPGSCVYFLNLKIPPQRQTSFTSSKFSWEHVHAYGVRNMKFRLWCNIRLLQKYWKNAKSATECHSNSNHSTSTEPISMPSSTSCSQVSFTS